MADFIDDFNRADSDSLGASWTEVAGDIDIVTNSARLGVQSVASFARYESDVGDEDMYTECLVVALQNHYTQLDAAVRYQAAANTFYGGRILFRSTSPNTFHRIVKFVAGVETALTAEVSYSRTLPDTVRFEARTVGGDVELTLLIDGVQVAQVTDSSSPLLTGQRGGMAMFSSHATTSAWPRVDTFGTGSLAGAPEEHEGSGTTSTVTAAPDPGAGAPEAAGAAQEATVTASTAAGTGRAAFDLPAATSTATAAAGAGTGTATLAGVGADSTITLTAMTGSGEVPPPPAVTASTYRVPRESRVTVVAAESRVLEAR